MSVSTGSANPDLDALMAGGDAFLKRIAELKSAQKNADQAITSANNEAARILHEASSKREADLAALSAEVEFARANVSAWGNQTKAEAVRLRDDAANDRKVTLEARTAAEKTLADAQKIKKEAEVNKAQILDAAQESANKIVTEAKAAAAKLTSEGARLKSQIEVALKAAQESKSKFDSKLEAIQSAAASVLKE